MDYSIGKENVNRIMQIYIYKNKLVNIIMYIE